MALSNTLQYSRYLNAYTPIHKDARFKVKPGMSLTGEILLEKQALLDYLIKKPVKAVSSFGKI